MNAEIQSVPLVRFPGFRVAFSLNRSGGGRCCSGININLASFPPAPANVTWQSQHIAKLPPNPSLFIVAILPAIGSTHSTQIFII